MNDLAEAMIIPPHSASPTSQNCLAPLFFTRIGRLESLELSTSSGRGMCFALRALTHTGFLIGYSFLGIDIKLGGENSTLPGYL